MSDPLKTSDPAPAQKPREHSAAELDSFFPYRLAIAAEAFSRSLAEVYGQNFGLTREEWRLLFLLAGEGDVTSTDVARRTTLDKVQVSRASQRLTEKGLIEGEVAAQDRRLRVYRATNAGRALFSQMMPGVAARADVILDQMSDSDRAALMQGLAAFSAIVVGAD